MPRISSVHYTASDFGPERFFIGAGCGRVIREAKPPAGEQSVAAMPDVAPFWRTIEPESPLAGKLSCGRDWVAARRAAEANG